MGVVLEAIGTSRVPGGRAPSSVDLAVDAAGVALDRADTELCEVGLIINAGVFRDENICEPAMAPFVQRALERSRGAGADILSFDLADGACGMWTAVRVASGFIESGAIQRALVVASDVDTTASVSSGWVFDPVGGAVLLARGAPGEGFTAFHSESFAKHSNRFEAHVEFIGNSADRPVTLYAYARVTTSARSAVVARPPRSRASRRALRARTARWISSFLLPFRRASRLHCPPLSPKLPGRSRV